MADASLAHQSNVSQDYFDEVCLENHVDFELSEEDAVKETIQQLESSFIGGDGKKNLPSYLILSFPTSEAGIKERKINQVLKSNIAVIRSGSVAVSDDADHGKNLRDALKTLVDTIQTVDKNERVTRFVLYGGFEACVQLWHENVEGRSDHLYTLLLDAFAVERATRQQQESVLSLQDLQKHFLRLWPVWLSTFEEEISEKLECWNLQRINQILQLASYGVKYSEPNKKSFMSSRVSASMKSSPMSLLGALDLLSSVETELLEVHGLVGEPVCRLIAALCTYDDFRISEGGPTVSSASSHVQIFHQNNAVVRIARYLTESMETSAILALRAMAIHDDIVQVMVAVGLLETSGDLLGKMLSGSAEEDSPSTPEGLTAVVGFFRNVCANDEIKSKLCTGERSVVHGVILAMERYPEVAKLQEHACATFAAMALRSPRNAEFLVNQYAVTDFILRAMKKHSSRTTVQRQGALALRNLVSRSKELRHTILQAGAADVLKDIAARHVSCQDEAYAALRDLGIAVSMKRVEQDANGHLIVKETEMFGERNINFRPVFD